MKKFLVVFFAAVMAVSCLKDGPSNSIQYNLLATFEYVSDYDIPDQFGADSLYFHQDGGQGMGWNDVFFMYKVSEDKKEFKGGFILSCLKGKMYAEGYESDKSADLYRVNAPADSTRTYMVFVDAGSDADMPEHDVKFVGDEYGTCKLLGCYVNVPLYVAAAAVKEFKDGDALTLKATAYLDGVVTNEKSIDLITCKDGIVELLPKWTLFDLSAISDIQYLDFDVQSTNPNVPEIFCMDNFGARVAMEY